MNAACHGDLSMYLRQECKRLGKQKHLPKRQARNTLCRHCIGTLAQELRHMCSNELSGL